LVDLGLDGFGGGLAGLVDGKVEVNFTNSQEARFSASE
jgi:hypothetical protein